MTKINTTDWRKLNPVLEAMIGTHTLTGGIAIDPVTGDVGAAPDITVEITRELAIKAQALGWSLHEMLAEATRLSQAELVNIRCGGVAPPLAN